MLAGLLLLYMWPFSRTAVLIPLTWWAMYLFNKWHVSRPIFGLVDEVAEKAGFYPVYPHRDEKPRPATVTQPEDRKAEPADVLPATSPIAAAK
jgi:hypothetical protein